MRLTRLLLLATISLSAADPLRIFKCVGCERDADGKIKRSKAKARQFLKAVGWDLPTRDVRVDHIIALACGPQSGAYDDLGNMQLQWKAEAAAKDRWELSRAACTPGAQSRFLLEQGQRMPNAYSRTTPAAWVIERVQQMKIEYQKGKR